MDETLLRRGHLTWALKEEYDFLGYGWGGGMRQGRKGITGKEKTGKHSIFSLKTNSRNQSTFEGQIFRSDLKWAKLSYWAKVSHL